MIHHTEEFAPPGHAAGTARVRGRRRGPIAAGGWPGAGAVIVAGALLLGLTGCGASGWQYRETLRQLYQVDREGRLQHATTIQQLGWSSRMLKSLLGPFGYDPAPSPVKVQEPGKLGRESILGLSGSLADDPALVAAAMPWFSNLALHAPFSLTRAQAVKAIATALDRQVPRPPPAKDLIEESQASIDQAIMDLVGSYTVVGPDQKAPVPLSPERKLAIVKILATTDYKTLALVRKALMSLGVIARDLSEETVAVQEASVDGIHRLSWTLSRLTLQTVLARPQEDPVVRGSAAEALSAARAPWAERLLLTVVKPASDPIPLRKESHPRVLRKAYRALSAYRTPRVAQTLIAVVRANPSPLESALARRALTAYTQKDLGDDPDAWEKRLVEMGYLQPKSGDQAFRVEK